MFAIDNSWRYFSDDEIEGISREITGSIEPWIQDFYSTWMLRGINNSEAARWLHSVEQRAPAIVFNTLVQKARQEFSSGRIRKIRTIINKELQPA